MTRPALDHLVRAAASPIHGTGVFAVVPIAAGTLIGVYEGRPTDHDGVHVLWVEAEGGGWLGIEGTGTLRYLNHSRTPNVEFDATELRAVRDLVAGEELLFDYGEEWAHVP